ncbi:arginyl-tRNA--protein transferase 1 isoform X2 [Frankliniella occidentalis]|uniref:Arginyl-tRNA--protein transferase 1 n=1 Tax=Frankliniella occidentalis TaxID=133901 RepID=A0A9C6U845_FRAOC|nr:arginyl-tRNA--protein transferase 1 isoform X2 [Frankliniella occidentalis]
MLGMWAHQLTVHDYQDLIDRGWRRSGYYCYKPTMHKICCPMYTIKCQAIDFKITKSQKKVIKRVNRFIDLGERVKSKLTGDDSNTCVFQEASSEGNPDWMAAQQTSHVASVNKEKFAQLKSSLQELKGDYSGASRETDTEVITESSDCLKQEVKLQDIVEENPATGTRSLKPGNGPDKDKPPCKKAKLLRLERRKQKLESKGLPLETSAQKQDINPKKLEDFLYQKMPPNPAHRLQVRLVRSQPPSAEFKNSFVESLNVYRRYQMAIHRDPETKCSESQYKRFLVKSPLELKLVRADELASVDQTWMWNLFVKYQKKIHKERDDECDRETFQHFLVDTPLKAWRPADGSGPPQGYGSFHQQYWLDEKLVAVGVIDILPRCVSSVYFYYDPDFSDLTLGTYGSLREVAFVRTLHSNAPELKWYYMGFYIHSCPKMRYKAGLSPSMLLCPETYTWHPIEECLPLLDKKKYSRLEPNPSVVDGNAFDNINELVVFYDLRPMYYSRYRELRGGSNDLEDEEVLHYAQLVGRTCAKRVLLLR